MSYTQHAYDILEVTSNFYSTLEQTADIQQKIAALKEMRNKEKITEKGYLEMVAPYKAQLAEIRRKGQEEATGKIAEINQKYSACVDAWAMPTPDKKHEDLTLLDGSLSISVEQLETLGEKHKSNPVMVGAIQKYAADHGMSVSVVTPDARSKKEAFDVLCATATKALREEHGMYRAIFSDKDSFEKHALASALVDSGE